MRRGSHIASGLRNRGLAAGALAGLLMSPAAAAEDTACPEPLQSMQRVEMMFGRNIGGRLGVNEAAWSRFLRDEVTARFPNGLSVIDAAGQWSDNGRVVREPSKLVIILTPDDAPAREKVAAIVAAYKQQFRQMSVWIVMRQVCGTL
jgi:Protein of unknown function (DUF3574)